MQTLLALIQWLASLLPFTIARKESRELDAEPLIDGYGELTTRQQTFITSLEKRLKDVEDDNAGLHEVAQKNAAEIAECNKHRADLERRLKVVEDLAEKEKQYAHDRVHEFENALKALKVDLEEVGIEPVRIAAVIKRVENRHAEEQRQRFLDSQ